MGIQSGAKTGAKMESWRKRNKVNSKGAKALSVISNVIGSIIMIIGVFLVIVSTTVNEGEGLIGYALFWLAGLGIVYGGHWCAMQIDKGHVEENKPLSRNQRRKLNRQ